MTEELLNIGLDFRRWISRLPGCCACGGIGPLHEDGLRYLHPHHVKTRGAGGKDLSNLLGLCWKCHSEVHSLGLFRWQTKHKIDAQGTAEMLFDLYADGVDAERVRLDDSRVSGSR